MAKMSKTGQRVENATFGNERKLNGSTHTGSNSLTKDEVKRLLEKDRDRIFKRFPKNKMM